MFYKLFLLVFMVRLLIAIDKPIVCSTIYAVVVLFLGAILGTFWGALISASISFVLASIYFWLLDRFDGSPLLWWVVAILGVPIILV